MFNQRFNNRPNHKAHRGVVGFIARPVAAFGRVISGPPMTDRERAAVAIAESRIRAYTSTFK